MFTLLATSHFTVSLKELKNIVFDYIAYDEK